MYQYKMKGSTCTQQIHLPYRGKGTVGAAHRFVTVLLDRIINKVHTKKISALAIGCASLYTFCMYAPNEKCWPLPTKAIPSPLRKDGIILHFKETKGLKARASDPNQKSRTYTVTAHNPASETISPLQRASQLTAAMCIAQAARAIKGDPLFDESPSDVLCSGIILSQIPLLLRGNTSDKALPYLWGFLIPSVLAGLLHYDYYYDKDMLAPIGFTVLLNNVVQLIHFAQRVWVEQPQEEPLPLSAEE